MSKGNLAFTAGVSGNPLGRPKGIKNKVKKLKVEEILASLDYEPFEELVNLARFARSEKVRCDAAIELCSYVAPKLKQVEFKNEGIAPFSISLNMAPKSDKPDSITFEPNKKILEDYSEE